MAPGPLFSRRYAGGWLVLTPGLVTFGGPYPDLAAHLLERIELARPSLCLCASGSDLGVAGRFAEEIEGLLDRECPVTLLGGTAGIPSELALVVLCGGDAAAWVEALAEETPIGKSLATSAEESLILAAGPAAAALGAWIAPAGEANLIGGCSWLTDAIVLPGVADPGEAARVRERLSSPARLYAVGLPEGAILALGPDGQVELWGSVRPTILLGAGWRNA